MALDAVAAAFRTAHGYEPPLGFIERAARCADAWEVRLSHQVRELPPFDRVLAELRALVEAWAVRG